LCDEGIRSFGRRTIDRPHKGQANRQIVQPIAASRTIWTFFGRFGFRDSRRGKQAERERNFALWPRFFPQSRPRAPFARTVGPLEIVTKSAKSRASQKQRTKIGFRRKGPRQQWNTASGKSPAGSYLEVGLAERMLNDLNDLVD